tara:strand:+ start:58 stop:558 length:501 start_codon:yes stop_codon:yes gene_type:complete
MATENTDTVASEELKILTEEEVAIVNPPVNESVNEEVTVITVNSPKKTKAKTPAQLEALQKARENLKLKRAADRALAAKAKHDQSEKIKQIEIMEQENAFLKRELLAHSKGKMENKSEKNDDVEDEKKDGTEPVEVLDEGPPQVERHASQPATRVTNQMLMRSLGF